MRHFSVILLLAALAACSTSRWADEPADLVAKGRNISALLGAGWEIAAPVSQLQSGLPEASDPSASDGQTWAAFTARLMAQDELRPVRNNAGEGYAIFRGGVLVDMVLVTIF